jgi:hypothetical protein
MGDLAAAIEKMLPPAVPAGRDFGSTPIGEGRLSTGRAALFGQRRDCDPVPGSAASAKRISAERECEPVFLMTAARWFSTVRWLMNGGPAACEPHRRVDDSLLAVVDPWNRGRYASIFAHAAANPLSRPHRTVADCTSALRKVAVDW